MRKNALLASITGNIIEWYDFGLFIYLAPLLAELYFPKEDSTASLLMILAVFAAGFIMRPIGALLFGLMGDRIGRASTLKITILLISLPSFVIALVPTYADWGITATLIIVAMRLLQGLCIGGEFAGAMVYMVESAPPRRRAFFSSLNNVGSNIGLIGATGVIALLSQQMGAELFASLGWRCAFLGGGVLGLIGLLLRGYLLETPIFQNQPQAQHPRKFTHPLRVLLSEHRLVFIRMLFILFLTASGCYALMNLLSTYLQTFMGYSIPQAMQVQTGFLLLSLVCIPLVGAAADKWGGTRLLRLAALGFVFFSLPCFWVLTKTHNALALLPLILFFCIEQGVMPSLLAQAFPPSIRYLGASCAYNLTQTFIGGTAPVLLVYLIHQTQCTIMPAVHLCIAGTITFFALRITLPKYSDDGSSLLGVPLLPSHGAKGQINNMAT